jgi:hypothetical protein
MMRVFVGLTLIMLLLVPLIQAQSSLRANLVEPEENAARKIVAVRVHVGGATLMDPVRGRPSWAAHVHYLLDNCPPVASASTQMSFHELSQGQHTIVVRLVNDKEEPIAQDQKLEIKIP